MKKKKIISAISALAMAVSSFGAISASAITTEDIGNKFNQELAPLFKAPDYTYTFQDDGTLCSYNKYLRYYDRFLIQLLCTVWQKYVPIYRN